MFQRRPIKRTRQGRYQINLSPGERELLRVLPQQLRELLNDPDEPALRRLFPPAYGDEVDRDKEAEYRRLMREDLIERHGEALDTLTHTAAAEELSEEELTAWLRSLNSLRLVLGTSLDVSEDDDPSTAVTPEHQIYYVLGYLQECVVGALAGGL